MHNDRVHGHGFPRRRSPRRRAWRETSGDIRGVPAPVCTWMPERNAERKAEAVPVGGKASGCPGW